MRFLPDRSARFCATGAGVLALAELAVWCLGHGHALAFGPDFVPMAPSTALLMLPICIAAVLRARAPGSRAARAVELLLTLSTLFGGLVFGLQFVLGSRLPVESWLAPNAETVGGIPVGRMSPLTAGCFVAVALVQWCGRVNGARWGTFRSLAGALALAVLAVSAIVAAGYCAGSPFMYGGATIPMALLTAVAFFLLSAATLLNAGTDSWPLRIFLRARSRADQDSGHAVEWHLLLLFVALATGIGAAGVQYLKHEQAKARLTAHAELDSILILKVAQVAQWRKERLTDANLIRTMPSVVRCALDALAQPESARTREMFTNSMQPLLATGSYDRVLLLDADLNVRLVHPRGPIPLLSEPIRRAAEQALRVREVALTDLHRTDENNPVHMDLLVPLIARREGTNETLPAAGLPLSADAGLLLLQLHAHDFLFPLIQTWPRSSQSVETLLVCREGGEVLFVNEPGYPKGTAMKSHLAMNDPDSAVALGLRGERGVQESVDYRDVPVVAAAHPVPDTPWVIVAKVDQAELYAPLRAEALRVVGMAIALLLAAALGITVLWRRRNEQFLRAQLATEHERRMLAERFEHLMRQASDAIVLADEENRILEANECAQALYGYSLAEMQQLPLSQLRAPECREVSEPPAIAPADAEHAAFETRHQAKDGRMFPVEIRSRAVDIGGKRYRFGIIRDISERKAHEAEIERLNRLYAALNQVRQVLVRAGSRDELLAESCRVLVEFGGFKVAWIGWLDRDAQAVLPVALAGNAGEFLAHVKASAAQLSEGRGPIGICLREGRSVVRNDLANTSGPMPRNNEAIRRGFRTFAAFPIRCNHRVDGVLVAYATEAGFFADKETALLEEAAGDIAFGLEKLERERQRQLAEHALHEKDALLREVSRMAHIGGWNFDPATGRGTWTDEVARIHDLDPATEATAELGLSVFHGEWRKKIEAAVRDAVELGRPYDLELELMTAKGNRKWVRTIGSADREGDRVVKVHGAMQDITTPKQVEAALRQSEARLRTLVKTLPDLVWLKDPQGVYLACNPRFESFFGATEAEITGKTDYDFTNRQMADSFRAHDAAAVAAGGPRMNEEEITFACDGHKELVETIKTPMFDMDGSLIGVLGISHDITARRQTEMDLRRSQSALLEAQRLAHLGNWELETLTGKVTWSDELCRICGRDPELGPLDLGEVAQHFSPESWARLSAAKELALAEGTPFECDAEVVRRDGTRAWVMSHGEAVRDAGGKIIGLRGTLQDITERKQAEEALRLAHARLRQVVDANIVGVAVANAAGEVFEANDYYLNLVGFTREEANQGMVDWRAMTPPEWLPADEHALQELRERGTCTPYEKEYVRRDGTRVPVGLSDAILPGGDGQIVAFALDLTERKRAEAALRQSEEQFRAMFELASIGMAQAEVQSGRWLRVNARFCAITGYSAAELLRMRVPEITHPEDRQLDWELFQKVVRGERPDYQLEKRYIRNGGEVIWVNVNMTVIRDATGTPVCTMAIIEDITERKRLEAQLRQQQKLESLGTLASGVAHEINNPITGIMNYAQLTQDRLPANSPLAEFTGEIMRETQRVASIVRNLLTFARNEKQSHSPARIADIIEGTLSLIRTVIRHDDITLTVDVPEDLPTLRCRSQQIQQVLMNLVTNARDALNERYPRHDPDKRLRVAASLLEKENRRWVRVTVEDHGTGIAPEVRERMFDPFFTTKPRDVGTGLGLSISHGIVKEHHGEWTVESRPGQFTRMHVDLPVDNGWEV